VGLSRSCRRSSWHRRDGRRTKRKWHISGQSIRCVLRKSGDRDSRCIAQGKPARQARNSHTLVAAFTSATPVRATGRLPETNTY